MVRLTLLILILALIAVGIVQIVTAGGNRAEHDRTAQSLVTTPAVTSRPDPTLIVTATVTIIVNTPINPIPQDVDAAVALFGGSATDWRPFQGNGWIFRSSKAMEITVPPDWRIDYTNPNGAIFSCGAEQRPGVYGPTTVETSAATLWYVPDETACPAWTIWSRAHGTEEDS